MAYAICTVPAAPVRTESAHRSEMSNQLFFGDTMEILEEKDEWVRIRSIFDEYEGWLTNHLITSVDEKIALTAPKYVAANLVNVIKYRGQTMNIPLCSPITGFDVQTGKLWDENYLFEGNTREIPANSDASQIITTAMLWLNSPYLWGGKTLLGVDCSGFVQTVFRYNGISLRRDAWQQAERGVTIPLEEAKSTDVAFFHNEKGRVVHVGILLESNKIIHASGRVRIDQFDKDGILNTDTGKRTHYLHSIKRFF
jgi:cell wall-associated NlpC family hydrolase